MRWGHLLLWSIVAYGLMVTRVGVAAGVGGGKLRVLPSNQPVVHTHIGKLINSGVRSTLYHTLKARSPLIGGYCAPLGKRTGSYFRPLRRTSRFNGGQFVP